MSNENIMETEDLDIKKKSYKNVKLSPFINKSSTSKVYLTILLMLVPQLIMLGVTKSFSNLIIICGCVAACLLSEIFSFIKRNHVKLSILTSVLNGILIGFFIPADYPVLTVCFITLFVMFFVKYSFTDLTLSWINPAVITVAVCWFIGQFNFPEFLVTRDFLSAKNPSLLLIQEGIFPTFRFDELVTSFLNETVFSIFRVSIPQGYVSVFWDNASVIPAFRFNFLTLLASIVLVMFEVISFEMPFFFLTTYLVLVKFVSPVFSGGVPMQGDMLLALLSSGTMFTAFFLLQSFGTAPLSRIGKIIYGLFGGIFAFIFSGCGTSPVGSIMTVFFLNILSPVIQFFENRTMCKKLTNLLRKENVRNNG